MTSLEHCENAPDATAEKQGLPNAHKSTERSPRDQRSILAGLDAEYNLIEDSSFANLVHSSLDSGEKFQRWFRYREGFSPELIHGAIKSSAIPVTSILDPFSGAGSTLVAARQANIPSVGFEVNPIVTTIARAKTHNYSMRDIADIRSAIRKFLAANAKMDKARRPGLAILDKFFREDVLDALLTIRHMIDVYPSSNVADFLMAGWLSILEGVSNVFKEGNGVKYRNRKRTKDGYITIPWEQVTGFEADGWKLVKERLAAQYGTMLDDLEIDCSLATPVIRDESSVSGIASIPDKSISLAIFSPPYCNNFNYMKIFKVELWMSGLVETYSDIRKIGAQALRSHVEMSIDLPESISLPAELYELIDNIDVSTLWNKKIPKTIVAYFIDMQMLLEDIYRTLSPGGNCHIVVGNSAYGGVIIPTDVILAKIAEKFGFQVDRVVVARHLTTSSQQRRAMEPLVQYLRESIIVLRRPLNA